jgi:arsenate reductase
MREAGVDISRQWSKTVDELAPVVFDRVVTVCGHADEHCPTFVGGPPVVHVGFDDPPQLALDMATAEEALDCYRRVRDEIRAYILSMDGAADDVNS